MIVSNRNARIVASLLQEARDDMVAITTAPNQDWRVNYATGAISKAAAVLGYTLTPIQEAPHVATQPQSQLDSGRLNLREESPAHSDLTHNFGA